MYENVSKAVETAANTVKKWIGNNDFFENLEKFCKDEDGNLIPDKLDEMLEIFNS
jgi:hypothetical protein